MKAAAVTLALLVFVSCAVRRASGPFRVLPATPDYLLRSPDLVETPFPQVLDRYTGLDQHAGWVDLRPGMELRIQNAYYRPGTARRGLEDYLGTETAHFQVRRNGTMRLIGVESRLPQRPRRQAAAQDLISPAARHLRYHRFYYAIVFRKIVARRQALSAPRVPVRGPDLTISVGPIRPGGSHTANARASVLLSAVSPSHLEKISTQLAGDPDSACKESADCTVFPPTCTAALEIEVFVNGALRTVAWGSAVGSVVTHPRRFSLRRRHAGKLTPIEINGTDPLALRLPLLPGDRIDWR